MLKNEFDISALIARFLAGNASKEECDVLEQWKQASGKNQELFDKICNPANLKELNRMAGGYDKSQAWKHLEQRIRPYRYVMLRKWTAYAAMFILPLMLGYFLIRNSSVTNENPDVNTAGVIRPGTAKATLTLADGSVVDLDKAKKFEFQEKNGTKINKDSSVLNYKNDGVSRKTEEVVYNKIEIPRGGEYSLVLSDGSVVHLNAMSSLRFPVNFAGDKREVELQGEAYFEVKKGTKPFVVKTKEMSVEVLGTVFNVSCYADDHVSRTTLVKGSVRVYPVNGQEAVVLEPSQQANFYKNANLLSVRDVDITSYIAWKSGLFNFKDWRLEDIMLYLARWYDIDVFYQNEAIKEMKFGCSINRYGEIAPILQLLERTGEVSAVLKGKTIVFTNK